MKKRHLWWSLVVIGLVARTAGAVQFFVPVPNLGGGFVFRTEFVRQDVSKSKVKFTYIAEGRSGVGLPAQSFTVLPGPSTRTVHPLLTDDYNRDFRRPPDRSDPKFYLSGPGLVLMEGEPGLVGVTTAVEIGGDPTSGWALPMLTHDDGFEPGATAYVLNLMKNSTAATQLSIFNFDPSPAQCSVTVLAPKGWTMDQRIGISVPGLGA